MTYSAVSYGRYWHTAGHVLRPLGVRGARWAKELFMTRWLWGLNMLVSSFGVRIILELSFPIDELSKRWIVLWISYSERWIFAGDENLLQDGGECSGEESVWRWFIRKPAGKHEGKNNTIAKFRRMGVLYDSQYTSYQYTKQLHSNDMQIIWGYRGRLHFEVTSVYQAR